VDVCHQLARKVTIMGNRVEGIGVADGEQCGIFEWMGMCSCVSDVTTNSSKQNI
jgi:hypothetical protein